jgi:radical SAM superfamily enzyme YgiQ (UPF0313 family)
MNGLPTETDEDIVGIADLAGKIVDLYYQNPNKPKGRPVEVSISVSCFVPKAHTPFQWFGQDSLDELIRKQKLLGQSIHSGKIRYSWHEAKVSRIEAVFARGDRRLSKALIQAYNDGCFFDGWDEYFSLDKWLEAFEKCKVDPAFYANRLRDYNEIMPWDHLDYCISKEFLIAENEKASKAQTTPHCRRQCSNCGANIYKGGVCVEKRKA